VNWNKEGSRIEVEEVRVSHIEDAAYVPPDSAIFGGPVGNVIWRSPEAHIRSRVTKASDIFSFAIVICSSFSMFISTRLTQASAYTRSSSA
jgi:hypothetical protein